MIIHLRIDMFQVSLYMSLILEHNETEEESWKVDEFSKTYFVKVTICDIVYLTFW